MVFTIQPAARPNHDSWWRRTIVNSSVDQRRSILEPETKNQDFSRRLTELLNDELLERVSRPGQYLGNEWGAARRAWDGAAVHLALAFPDLYELGMSNFGQRILYQIVNAQPHLMADRTYAPASDMEALMRQNRLPLWGWESRRALTDFELVGFSLQYELTYTNVLNMLDMAQIPVLASERVEPFPLIFGGGPSAVNPEPMAMFMDFFIVGDGEKAVPAVMEQVRAFQGRADGGDPHRRREELLHLLARNVPGLYVPRFYEPVEGKAFVQPLRQDLPARISRQIEPLTDANQPTGTLVPYLALVHDRQVLEVRRGCDRGCRFCQPGYTFLPVRERAASDLVRLSREALAKSGHQEYSLLSLCVSDYTSLNEAVRALNYEHMQSRASISFPSQRADRMNFDLADELKLVRKSGITLAPEAGSERLRAVINKGLHHEQIIQAISTAYQSGWTSVKLYFMLGLPTETDEDLAGIIEILREATSECQAIRRAEPQKYRRGLEFTCTISNFVPKPFTPFQWFGQIDAAETERRQRFLRGKLKESRLRNVTLNFTSPETSMLEAVISRGGREVGEIIYGAWQSGCTFDAWEERLDIGKWQAAAEATGQSLQALASTARPPGSTQPWEIVHAGLANWWLVNEWEKAMAVQETLPCSENTCHACGICSELQTTHRLASPKPEVLKKNPFVKELAAYTDNQDSHPSLFYMPAPQLEAAKTVSRIRFQFTKKGELRFISHLDLQHLFVRASRRAGIKLAFTEGFNPSAKLQLAAPLPLFQESLADVGEIELAEELSAQEFAWRLNEQLPPEVQVVRARSTEKKPGQSSLAMLVGRSLYRAEAAGGSALASGTRLTAAAAIARRIDEILQQSSLLVSVSERDGGESKREIRPGIFSLAVLKEAPLTLALELATGQALHVRPQDLLGLLSPDISWRITRTGLATPDGIPLFDLP